MTHSKVWLAVITFMICAPAFADSTNDPFQSVVTSYLAANPKPQFPEEARKFKVQAEFAVQEKQFDRAAELYGKVLEITPWWPQGHFNRALILGELKQYHVAMREMKMYVRLAPDAPDARAAQDRIYQWEGVAKQGYEGNLVNGKANGKGFYTYTNGDTYEGDFINGARIGKGVITLANGSRYEGDFVNDKMNGKGVFTFANGDRYEGDFVDEKRTGKGVYTLPSGVRYEGDFVDGKSTGKGVFTWPTGDRYEGDFVDGKFTGKGVFTWPSGDRYEGDFVNGKMSGNGIFTRPNSDRYEGDFVDDKRTGKGILTWANGNRYEGNIVDSKMTGKGVYTWSTGVRYEGDFVDGQRKGKGILTLANGVRYEGNFVPLGVVLDTSSPDSANALHKSDMKGAKIIEVMKGSVAEKSGISQGDVVVEYDGKPITKSDDLLIAIFVTPPGHAIQIKVVRGLQELNLTAQF
jgi:hypothetical protein